MNTLRYLVILFLISLASTVVANHLPDDIEPGDAVNDIQLPLTKQSAAELARIQSGGKVLSVSQEQHDGHIIFVVKILHDNGKVKLYRLDKDTAHSH